MPKRNFDMHFIPGSYKKIADSGVPYKWVGTCGGEWKENLHKMVQLIWPNAWAHGSICSWIWLEEGSELVFAEAWTNNAGLIWNYRIRKKGA